MLIRVHIKLYAYHGFRCLS